MEYLEKWTLMLAIPLVLGCTACSESAPEYGYVEISEAKGSFDTVSIAISDHEGFIKTSRVVEDFEICGSLFGLLFEQQEPTLDEMGLGPLAL